MAFVDPNEVTPGPAVPQSQQQAPIASGGAGVGGATKAPATPGQNLPAQPSAQLSAYLAANQPQATTFGQNVAQTVGGQVNAAGAAITPAVNTYTGGLYTVQPGETSVTTGGGGVTEGPGKLNPNIAFPVITTPISVDQLVSQSPSSLDPNAQAAFEQELGAAGAAPNAAGTFESTPAYQSVASGIQQAVEQANLWDSGNNVANLSTALQPFEGPNATAGDTTLDSLLLSQTPGAYGAIQNAVAPAAGLQGQLTTGTTGADQALQAAIAQDTATTAGANTAAQTFATNLTNYLNGAVTTNQAAQTAQEAANGPIYTDYNSGNLSAADAVALGIPSNQAAAWAADYNALNPAITTQQSVNAQPARYGTQDNINPVDLSSYLTQGAAPIPINAANVATTQNYSDVAALQALLGGNSNINLPISAATADQAGLGLNPAAGDTLNTAGIDAALQPLIYPAQQYVSAIQSGASSDPAQNSAEANAISQQINGMNGIIAYLNQLVGNSGQGIAPPPVEIDPVTGNPINPIRAI